MSDWREDLLTEICDCGYGDLYLLEDCKYDLGDVIQESRVQFGSIEINALVRTMFEIGMREIDEAIKDRLSHFDDLVEQYGGLREEEIEERNALEYLDPFQDIESWHNYLDTSIWIEKNGAIYNKYMKEALDHFYEMTGFEIRND